jgi:hypothetical protein
MQPQIVASDEDDVSIRDSRRNDGIKSSNAARHDSEDPHELDKLKECHAANDHRTYYISASGGIRAVEPIKFS